MIVALYLIFGYKYLEEYHDGIPWHCPGLRSEFEI
jgi:hypothetical protein